MEDKPTWLAVGALCLTGERGQILMQQRPAAKHHGGLWEFPGGKVENGENPRTALCREIAEELGIIINPGDLTPMLLADEQGSPAIVLFLYTCSKWQGDPAACEGQQWAWLDREEAAGLPLAPMDRSLLERLPC